MLIDDPSRKANHKNVNQSDDDDYEDNGSGIEDDAPEGFQPTITFPDLLRVPSTTMQTDDSPESQSFAASGQSSAASGQSSEPIGGLPRNRRPLSHPDVSSIDLSVPTARPLPPLPGNGQNSCFNGQSAPSMSRNPINNLNLPLGGDLSSQSASSSSSTQPQPLTSILNAISRIQSSVEILSRKFNERLDGLENRINEMTSKNPVGNQLNLNQMAPEFLNNFIQQQKREMHNQRRSFILSFADALRLAADPPINNGSTESPNFNNHHRPRPN